VRESLPKPDLHFYPVILAGGRGTRFWPMSRKRRAKQLLPLDGRETMIQQTVRRLLPLAPAKHCWVITNHDLLRELVRQLPRLTRRQIVAEPVGRNTAPAVGLAAFLLLRIDPAALIGMFPSDHVVEDESHYRELVRQGIEIARSGENIVVLGIRPTRAETGYGYIEAGAAISPSVLRVRRFTEKPDRANARKFLEAGHYYWNSGMFLWSARTLAQALSEHLPKTAAILDEIAAAYGSNRFARVFSRLYPQCENISIDYAVLEPRSSRGEQASGIFCLPADCGWKDLGSWTALHEHHLGKRKAKDGNLISGAGAFALDAENNYIHAPGKFVAAVGVNNLIVVETEDALLVTTREQAQDVGKVVKYLDEKRLHKLV